MVSAMKKVRRRNVVKGLYPWGKAELTDRWVILHEHGRPKWAIYYKQKSPSVVVPCHMFGSQTRER